VQKDAAKLFDTKTCQAIARHRCDWQKKTGEATARERAKQSEGMRKVKKRNKRRNTKEK
jgi:hypothetical protein